MVVSLYLNNLKSAVYAWHDMMFNVCQPNQAGRAAHM